MKAKRKGRNERWEMGVYWGRMEGAEDERQREQIKRGKGEMKKNDGIRAKKRG